MPYPPAVPPATRVNTDPQFDNHPADHNAIANALNAILAELGNDPSGAAADLTVRLQSYMPLGSVTMFAGAAAPTGWLLCDGTAVSRTTYAALYALLQATYGAGDGINTFNLPNLIGRFPVGKGSAPFNNLNDRSGNKDAIIPVHDHSMNHDHPNVTSTTVSADHVHNTPFADGYDINSSAAAGSTNAIYQPSGLPVNFITRPSAAVASDIPAAGLNTGGISANHTHDVDVPNYVGNTGLANGGVAVTNANLPPYITLNFIIKALP